MKNAKYELFSRMQRQYHRKHPWRLEKGPAPFTGGLFIPHSYSNTKPDELSWWADVGFILNGRRVIVWWQHPRDAYFTEVEDRGWQEAQLGLRDEEKLCYMHTDRAVQRMADDGIDFEVQLAWRMERLPWALGVTLVAPLNVRNEEELAVVAHLARQLLRGETTLAAEFNNYTYTKADWLREQPLRKGSAAIL